LNANGQHNFWENWSSCTALGEIHNDLTLQQVNQLLKGSKGHSISLFKSVLVTQLLGMRMP